MFGGFFKKLDFSKKFEKKEELLSCIDSAQRDGGSIEIVITKSKFEKVLNKKFESNEEFITGFLTMFEGALKEQGIKLKKNREEGQGYIIRQKIGEMDVKKSYFHLPIVFNSERDSQRVMRSLFGYGC